MFCEMYYSKLNLIVSNHLKLIIQFLNWKWTIKSEVLEIKTF